MERTIQHLLEEDLIFQKMLNHIKTKFNCHTIILYGSRARGVGVTDTSDYDLIAVRRTGENIREAWVFLTKTAKCQLTDFSPVDLFNSSTIAERSTLPIAFKKSYCA